MVKPREAGFEFVGMSSVGPTIAVIMDRERRDVEKAIAYPGLRIAVETKIESKGMVIEERKEQEEGPSLTPEIPMVS